MRTTIKSSMLSLSRLGRSKVLLRLFEAQRWGVSRFVTFAIIFSSLAWAQDQPALTLNQISKLLKGGVGSARVVQLVEQRGVSFELNDAAVRQLKADGANDAVLAAVKKLAVRYAEDQRRTRLKEASDQKLIEERKREEATAQRLEEVRRELREERKRTERQPAVTQKGQQELARNSAETKGSAQQGAKQKTLQGAGATLMAQEDVGRVASLRNIVIKEGGEVSGAVVNDTKNTVRDVQLQIVYAWRWKNESKPGKDDPGTARYYVLSQEIPPRQSRSFHYKPSPPLASRDDGQFDISVKIVGFAQVIQPAAP